MPRRVMLLANVAFVMLAKASLKIGNIAESLD
jgi:hypothetical protein